MDNFNQLFGYHDGYYDMDFYGSKRYDYFAVSRTMPIRR
jgi:hypothetical protein